MSAPGGLGLLGSGLRESLAAGYDRRQLTRDLAAGLLVGVVAIPLAMALAIAVGLPPEHGLYTAVAAGFLCALLGGSRIQVVGPTAAFVAILAPIVHQHGLQGLLLVENDHRLEHVVDLVGGEAELNLVPRGDHPGTLEVADAGAVERDVADGQFRGIRGGLGQTRGCDEEGGKKDEPE